ncbi:class I SAM-dependent methyltransferase [Gramella sp. BOM4]|nr:class I SAM-dependent methyltransferase [Christiangramia bathymodioli]
MKDNFSENPGNYLKFRPDYPEEIFQFIKSKLKNSNRAWDVGTGNGQVAKSISDYFKIIEATDISDEQLKYSFKHPNIHYSAQVAEKVDFPDDSFDFIISGQAVHWFDFDKFYSEVKRCLKPDGLIAILGYGLFRSTHDVNKVIDRFYTDIIGPYWDEERKYLDDNYSSIPFPFEEIQTPDFEQNYTWSFEHVLGYLRTWSAVKHYREKHHSDPVKLVERELKQAFGDLNKVSFPILFRMGKDTSPDQ